MGLTEDRWISITVSADPLPDLIVQEINYSPNQPESGDYVTFTVTIKNQGSVSTGSRVDIELFVDGSSKGSDTISSLNAGSSTTKNFHWTYTSGTHSIKAIVDNDNDVDESNEFNNELIVSISSTGSTSSEDLGNENDPYSDNSDYDQYSDGFDSDSRSAVNGLIFLGIIIVIIIVPIVVGISSAKKFLNK